MIRSFADVLSGDNAFYNAPDYEKSTQKELAAKTLRPVSYSWNTERKVTRIAKAIFSFIIFPIIIYQLLHSLAGKFALLPASTPRLVGCSANDVHEARTGIALGGKWKYKRITIGVDGYKIDAMIVGQASTLGNGRWILKSNGNGEFYEEKLHDHNFMQILSKVKGNAIVFNYPGVGRSSGLPNRYAMAKAYRALLRFLEDKDRGIGAREIIGHAFSIGTGVQGDALKTHQLVKGIKYLFIKENPFSNLAITTSLFTIRPLGFLVKILGWNIDSVESSKKLLVPEIITQTASVNSVEVLVDSSKIIDDGIIGAKATLAKALLDDAHCPKDKKLFLGTPGGHCYVAPHDILSGEIESHLAKA